MKTCACACVRVCCACTQVPTLACAFWGTVPQLRSLARAVEEKPLLICRPHIQIKDTYKWTKMTADIAPVVLPPTGVQIPGC